MRKEKLKEVNFLFFDLMALYHQKLGDLFHLEDDREPHCNKNQKKAMFIIYREGRATFSDIGKFLNLQKGSLTTLVDSLVESQLVRREPGERDRRKTWLYLTETGNAYIKYKLRRYYREFSKKFDSVGPGELEVLVKRIEYIIRLLQKL
jgi:DNA-binding MarR family transcriptional regulator